MTFNLAVNELGRITLSKEAAATIAGLAAIECYGLAGMVSRNVANGLGSILGRDTIKKGVEVYENEEGLIVDVYIMVSYGTKISEVAHNVMQKIRYVMEEVAGIKVARVNVNVQGVKVTKG